jgi:hypothetical protein
MLPDPARFVSTRDDRSVAQLQKEALALRENRAEERARAVSAFDPEVHRTKRHLVANRFEEVRGGRGQVSNRLPSEKALDRLREGHDRRVCALTGTSRAARAIADCKD